MEYSHHDNVKCALPSYIHVHGYTGPKDESYCSWDGGDFMTPLRMGKCRHCWYLEFPIQHFHSGWTQVIEKLGSKLMNEGTSANWNHICIMIWIIWVTIKTVWGRRMDWEGRRKWSLWSRCIVWEKNTFKCEC